MSRQDVQEDEEEKRQEENLKEHLHRAHSRRRSLLDRIRDPERSNSAGGALRTKWAMSRQDVQEDEEEKRQEENLKEQMKIAFRYEGLRRPACSFRRWRTTTTTSRRPGALRRLP
jgi:hypothetical protein